MIDTCTKLDLHIHSVASLKIDGKIVEENTLENLGILIDNLKKDGINMLSITDHNNFDYKIYEKLKEEELTDSCIYKILPGVELETEIEKNKVHVICIFDDRDDSKVKKISGVLNSVEYPLSKDDFEKILREINLNVVIIVHQKSSPLAKSQKNSLGQCGPEIFNKLVGIGYFDALEFPSSKVEGMLKHYLYKENLDDIASISGSDCHNWNVYPKARDTSSETPPPIYIRSLPTFKGLVMAITEPSRISNTITNKANNISYLDKIELNIDNNKYEIELSHRINVIIGDNSLGKSMLLNKLTNTKQHSSIEKGYEKFLKKNGIEIISIIHNEDSVEYYKQGEIREKFEKDGAQLPILFSDKFNPINLDKDKSFIKDILKNITKRWAYNTKVHKLCSQLNEQLQIPLLNKDSIHHLSIISNLTKLATIEDNYTTIYSDIVNQLNQLIDSPITSPEEVIKLKSVIVIIDEIGKSYTNRQKNIIANNNIINALTEAALIHNNRIKKMSNDNDIEMINFLNISDQAAKTIASNLLAKSKINDYSLEKVGNIKIKPSVNKIGQYNFISTVQEENIDNNILSKCILEIFNNSKIKDIDSILNMTTAVAEANFMSDIQNKEGTTDDKFINNVIDRLEQGPLAMKNSIIRSEQEFDEGNSAGTNAIIFLDLISQDSTRKMLILDQPEDYVAQAKIGTELIDIIRRMANNRQILIVTHNPQLVVNLDADNVISISNQNGKVSVTNGCLEYEDNDKSINILSEVANVLDGGNDIIKKRWRRYDKTASKN